MPSGSYGPTKYVMERRSIKVTGFQSEYAEDTFHTDKSVNDIAEIQTVSHNRRK